MRLLAQFVDVLLSLAMQGCRVSEELASATALRARSPWASGSPPTSLVTGPSYERASRSAGTRRRPVLLPSAFRAQCLSGAALPVGPMPDRSFLRALSARVWWVQG